MSGTHEVPDPLNTLSKIDEKEYYQLEKNAQIVGEKIRNGYFLQTAINSVKMKIESEEI